MPAAPLYFSSISDHSAPVIENAELLWFRPSVAAGCPSRVVFAHPDSGHVSSLVARTVVPVTLLPDMTGHPEPWSMDVDDAAHQGVCHVVLEVDPAVTSSIAWVTHVVQHLSGGWGENAPVPGGLAGRTGDSPEVVWQDFKPCPYLFDSFAGDLGHYAGRLALWAEQELGVGTWQSSRAAQDVLCWGLAVPLLEVLGPPTLSTSEHCSRVARRFGRQLRFFARSACKCLADDQERDGHRDRLEVLLQEEFSLPQAEPSLIRVLWRFAGSLLTEYGVRRPSGVPA